MSSNNPHDRESDGGPAFPIQCHDRVEDWEGMSLRDYFAAKALPFILDRYSFKPQIAEEAYAIADALIERRKHL